LFFGLVCLLFSGVMIRAVLDRSVLVNPFAYLHAARRYCSTTPQGKKPPFNVLFFGTDHISIPTFAKLVENQKGEKDVVSAVELVCPADPPTRRNKPVEICAAKEYALKEGVPVHQIPLVTKMKDWRVPTHASGLPWDVAVVVSFGYFIPRPVLNTFTMGCINMHPSLLPRHRGASPMYHTLLNDEKVTGISIIELHPTTFDAGKILLQEKYDITPETTYMKLAGDLSGMGAEAIMKTLRNFSSMMAAAAPQPTEGVTKAPKINPIDGNIDWKKHSNLDVYRLWRAYGDTCGIHTMLQHPAGSRVRVRLCDILNPATTPVPNDLPKDATSSSIFPHPKTNLLWAKCNEGWSAIGSLQTEAKKVLKAIEWSNGYKIGLPARANSFVEVMP